MTINQQQEMEELVQRFGTPLVHRTVPFGTSTYWTQQAWNRTREVCMVIRRPHDCLLTFTKTFYPQGVYRLLTGGVEFHETVLEALHREVYEETGLQASVERFLACISYHAEEDKDSAIRFTAFAFLLDGREGTPQVIDPQEQLASYQEVPIDEIGHIAQQLECLPDTHSSMLKESWKHWGRFRAVIHRAVAESLQML